LDAQTQRNLELFASIRDGTREGSLLAVIDLTRTALGARLLRRWLGQALLDITEIQRRQDRVEFFFASAVRRGRVGALLGRLPDLERLLGRIGAAVASPRDLVALRRGLELLPEVRSILAEGDDGLGRELAAALPSCDDVVGLIAAAIADDPPVALEQGGVVRPGFSPELDELRAVAGDARSYLLDLERRQRERTGIRNLKVGYNKVFGYYIEVSKPNLRLVPPDYQRRQTLVGGERFTTPELREYEFKILHAEERGRELEASLFRQVCAQVAGESKRIAAAAQALAQVDVFSALAKAAARYDYIRPQVDEGDEIVIGDGRHPVVERALPPGAFVPNDTHLANGDAQIVVLTGPNMAGKSTYLRQVALIALMAQVGSFVPASSARLGVVDHIFTRIGAVDDIAAGRSTFMVEMVETAAILHNATPRSLLVFDEIGRGTSTYDGLAIAQAVVEFIHNRPDLAAKTLFATHYHELVNMASLLPRLRNFNVAVAEEGGQVVFLHKILPGGADRSYGVHVAQLAGLPRAVVQRAREVLDQLESGDQRSRRRHRPPPAVQLPLLSWSSPLLEDLASLDVDSLTPLQALTRLYELRQRARQDT
ncbi:MAG: DNA mismatch repair protein MutS, partial [Dehalococcoidia bacterium]